MPRAPLDHPTLLDGAMGTALVARGLAAGALPEEWVLERPDEVAAVHGAHAAAGAELVLTCTFNAAGPRLDARVPAGRLEEVCEAAVRLARRGAPGARVAGAVGPTALYGPGRAAPDPAAVTGRYARAARALAAAGADLLWLESQWDLVEARLALAAAREAGVPVVVTFALRDDGTRLAAPDGTPAEALLEAIAADGAAAVGVNCVPAGLALTALAGWASGRLGLTGVPLVAKPSPGLPGEVLSPEAFAEALRPALGAGLSVVGGCCGAGPEHLRALRALLPRRR